MVSFPAPASYKFNTFKGIRTRNGIAANGTISATVCQNVDFAPSAYDAGVLIRTSYGNYKVLEYETLYAFVYQNHIAYVKDLQITSTTKFYDETETEIEDENWAAALNDDDEYVVQYDENDAEYDSTKNTSIWTIVKGFEASQEGRKHLLFYVENSSIGRLVEYNSSGGNYTTLVDNLTKTETGEANGFTMIDAAYDVFIFTNGIEYYSVQIYPQQVITQLHPEYEGKAVTGLAICEQDGSLVIGSNEGVVLASRKGDVTDFDYATPTDSNKAWYQIFGKKITAVVPYIDALLVFTEEDSTVLSGNMSNADTAVRQDASLGGCMSYESWCKHDKYLFFYDNRQKNIYYYMQNNYGQKVLGEPIAPEVQKFFNNVERLQMVSYIGDNRSEIWLLSNNFKLIYDYYIGEWGERNCQALTSYFVYDNAVFSTGSYKCFREKAGNLCMFDGVYYPSQYSMQLINLGSFSNMKEMEIQPLFSVTQDFNNTFFIDCTINGKKTKTKYVKMFFQGAIWADETPQDDGTPEAELWAEGDDQYDMTVVGQVFPAENDSVIQQIKGKFISNWYYLQFTIRTEKQGEDFSITCFEIKGITQEDDTTGRK